MPKNFSKKLFIILIFPLLTASFLFLSPPAKAAINDSKPNWKMPDLQVDINGLKGKLAAAKPAECGVDDKGNEQFCISWISMYIAGIFKYAIGVVGIVAAVVMMIGGLIWLTAGGNQTRVGEAKAYLAASVTGLVIALSSYLILYQINPELTNLKPIKVAQIKGIPPTATTTATGFVDAPSPELASFISCMEKEGIPGSAIVKPPTDSHIALKTCNPMDPNEKFSDPVRCQHAKNSCHYGGKTCQNKGSFAIDIDDSVDAKKVAKAAADCGFEINPGEYGYLTARCILNEKGTHHHVSIGLSCGCDTAIDNPPSLQKLNYCDDLKKL